MSPQTETKASVGFKAGVKEYKLTYYTPEYETKLVSIEPKRTLATTAIFHRCFSLTQKNSEEVEEEASPISLLSSRS
jgi:hypothetical protein